MVITIKSVPYQETYRIRNTVLWPNKPISFSKVADDVNGQHYGAYVHDELVCVVSVFIDNNKARLRKFACLHEFQGKGIGSMMIKNIISQLQSQGIEELWFDAREDALAFYERFNFNRQGERFYKSEVAYFKMSKKL